MTHLEVHFTVDEPLAHELLDLVSDHVITMSSDFIRNGHDYSDDIVYHKYNRTMPYDAAYWEDSLHSRPF